VWCFGKWGVIPQELVGLQKEMGENTF